MPISIDSLFTPTTRRFSIEELFAPDERLKYKADRFKVPTAKTPERPWESLQVTDVGEPPPQAVTEEEAAEIAPRPRPFGAQAAEVSEAINPATITWYVRELLKEGPVEEPPKILRERGREISAEMPGGKAAQFAIDALKFGTTDLAAFAGHIGDALAEAVNNGNTEPAKMLISGIAQDLAKARLITETGQYKAAKKIFGGNPLAAAWFKTVEFLQEHGPFPPTEKELEEMQQERHTNLFWNTAGRALVLSGILKLGAKFAPKLQNITEGIGKRTGGYLGELEEVPVAPSKPRLGTVPPEKLVAEIRKALEPEPTPKLRRRLHRLLEREPEILEEPTAKLEIVETPDIQVQRIRDMSHGELADEALRLMGPRFGSEGAIERIVRMSPEELRETVSGGRIPVEEVRGAKESRTGLKEKGQEVTPPRETPETGEGGGERVRVRGDEEQTRLETKPGEKEIPKEPQEVEPPEPQKVSPERPPYEQYVEEADRLIREFDPKSGLRKGHSVDIQLTRHKKPHRAKVKEILTDEAGNPTNVVVEWTQKVRRKAGRFKKVKENVTYTEKVPISEVNVPPSTAGLRQHYEALRALPEEYRGQARKDAKAFDDMLEKNAEMFVEPEYIKENYPELLYGGYGTKPGDIALGKLRQDMRYRAGEALGVENMENPVQRARYLGELREHIEKNKPAPEAYGEFEEITPMEYMGSGPRLFRSLSEILGAETRGLARPFKVHVEKEPFKPGIGKWFRTPSNYLGAVPGQKPRDITGARIVRRTLKLEHEARIQQGLSVEYLNDNFFGLIDKADLGKGKERWNKVAEAIEQTPLEVEGRTDLAPSTKQAVRNVKDWFESNRQVLISEMRKDMSRYMSEDQVRKAVPDDWGVKEYLTHIFPGDFLIKIKGPSGLQTIGSAYTKLDAIKLIAEDFNGRLGAKPSDYVVLRKRVLATDPFKMVGERKAEIIENLTKASELTPEEIKAILEGKKYKAKTVYDPLKERKGVAGYSTDLPFVLELYNDFMARKVMISKMRRKINPLLRRLDNTGREDLADYCRDVVAYTLGRRNPWSEAVDNTIQKIPWVRDRVRSHVLERWSGKIKGGQRFLLLTASPKFHLLNRLQTFQTLLPIMDKKMAREFLRGQAMLTAEERSLLEKHGVRFLTGGKLEEAGKPAFGGAIREKISGKTAGFGAAETFNQELAWVVMYKHARKLGLNDARAADYAFLRGNIYSQFAHFKADVPKLFQNPVATTLLPFRRFPIKTYEMLWDMTKTGNVSGLTKFLTMHLVVGGTRALTGTTAKIGTLAYLASQTFGVESLKDAQSPSEIERKAYKSLKENLGETTADAVFWGLPSLLDLDLSYSVQLVDRDYGATAAEEIVNEFAGPFVSTGVSVAKAAAAKKGLVTSPLERGARALGHRVAGLRWTLALEKVLTGDYDFKTADGKLRFQGDLKDVLVEGLGGRPLEAGKMDVLLSGMTDLATAWDSHVDDVVAAFIDEDYKKLFGLIDEWNQLHPDIPMTAAMVEDRIKRRMKDAGKYIDERMWQRMPKALKGYFMDEIKFEEEGE